MIVYTSAGGAHGWRPSVTVGSKPRQVGDWTPGRMTTRASSCKRLDMFQADLVARSDTRRDIVRHSVQSCNHRACIGHDMHERRDDVDSEKRHPNRASPMSHSFTEWMPSIKPAQTDTSLTPALGSRMQRVTLHAISIHDGTFAFDPRLHAMLTGRH